MGWVYLLVGMTDFFFSYNEELSLIYMAARLDGAFAAVFRVFHEVKISASHLPPFIIGLLLLLVNQFFVVVLGML